MYMHAHASIILYDDIITKTRFIYMHIHDDIMITNFGCCSPPQYNNNYYAVL